MKVAGEHCFPRHTQLLNRCAYHVRHESHTIKTARRKSDFITSSTPRHKWNCSIVENQAGGKCQRRPLETWRPAVDASADSYVNKGEGNALTGGNEEVTTAESCQRKDMALTQLLANKTSQHQYHHILFVITLRNTAIKMKTLDPKDLFF